MQAIIIASLDEDVFDNVTDHCREVEKNLKKIFLSTDPDLSVKFWYSADDLSDVKGLTVALVAMKDSAVAYFCKGWEKHKETNILHYICETYGIQRMEE